MRRTPCSRDASAKFLAAVGDEVESLTPPIGGNAPRPFDDRNHRAEIVRLQAGFKDEVDKAGGEQTVGIAISAKARELDGRRDPREGATHMSPMIARSRRPTT